MLSQDLLSILCCPETHQPLRLADETLVSRLNELIQAGKLKNRGDEPVTELIDAALVRQDGTCVYPIRQNLPVLLVNQAIPIQGWQLNSTL
jgi:uncharacterized protein